MAQWLDVYKLGVARREPSSQHRLAIQPGRGGTFVAVNANGEERNTGDSLSDAMAFAGVSAKDKDLRVWTCETGLNALFVVDWRYSARGTVVEKHTSPPLPSTDLSA